MASSITLKIAGLTSIITFAKTDQEVGAILKRFVINKVAPPPEGLTVTQTNQYYLDEAVAEIVRMVRYNATRVSLKEAKDAQANLEEQAEIDNAL